MLRCQFLHWPSLSTFLFFSLFVGQLGFSIWELLRVKENRTEKGFVTHSGSTMLCFSETRYVA